MGVTGFIRLAPLPSLGNDLTLPLKNHWAHWVEGRARHRTQGGGIIGIPGLSILTPHPISLPFAL